tara:strand:- start:41 stop:379 length:339 start_codon:yes stop_codon:yes gene_type:complete
MNYFLKANKNLITYSLILLVLVPLFGINFFISFLGNILLLLFLIPLFLLIIGVLIFNSFKSKINTCSNCGTIYFSSNGTCINCGSNLDIVSKDEINKKPSESTIEVKAEEIK